MNVFFTDGHERGFGTFPLKGEVLRKAILAAVEVGYRAFDTAQMYGNEAETGAALRESGLARQDYIVTTKVHPDNYAPERFIPSVEASLEALGMDRVDVLLLHWPPADGNIAPSLALLEEAHARGLARHVGVSNYTAAMMHEARRRLSVPIVTNQVEFHPFLDQSRLLAASAETGIPLSAYCAVARGEAARDPELARIARGYGRSPTQIALRWILQKGVSVNASSTRPEHIRENFQVMDFTLATPDIARIDRLGVRRLRFVDRDRIPWAPEWD